jgi:hypothetical protein
VALGLQRTRTLGLCVNSYKHGDDARLIGCIWKTRTVRICVSENYANNGSLKVNGYSLIVPISLTC